MCDVYAVACACVSLCVDVSDWMRVSCKQYNLLLLYNSRLNRYFKRVFYKLFESAKSVHITPKPEIS